MYLYSVYKYEDGDEDSFYLRRSIDYKITCGENLLNVTTLSSRSRMKGVNYYSLSCDILGKPLIAIPRGRKLDLKEEINIFGQKETEIVLDKKSEKKLQEEINEMNVVIEEIRNKTDNKKSLFMEYYLKQIAREREIIQRAAETKEEIVINTGIVKNRKHKMPMGYRDLFTTYVLPDGSFREEVIRS